MFLIKNLIASTIHLGNKTNKWNPRTSNYLLGIRDGIFVIDLEQTIIMMKRALTFIKKVCSRRGFIFYVPLLPINKIQGHVGTDKIQQNIENKIKPFTSSLEENNLIFLSPEYLSFSKQRGMLYAWTQKRKNLYISTLNENSLVADKNAFNLFFKPEALYIVDTNTNTALVKEALKVQIPIIGILDSNSNTYNIQYPIPGNNDNIEAQKLYTELLINSIVDAKKTEIKMISTKITN